MNSGVSKRRFGKVLMGATLVWVGAAVLWGQTGSSSPQSAPAPRAASPAPAQAQPPAASRNRGRANAAHVEPRRLTGARGRHCPAVVTQNDG